MANKLNCDVCEIQRASYYCEADEAYLCAACDSSVHGANTLASRHKRVGLHEDNLTQEGEGDGVCPVQAFPDTGPMRTLEFPVGGIKIGDITFARVSGNAAGIGMLSRKEEEDLHQVPRFVPVAQELPSLEPFRFHALAIAGGPPRADSKFISLFESEAERGVDMVEHKRHEEDAAQENLGVVPEMPAPQLGELPVKGLKADKEREARVNRYREKRRTRMFSKKIRYEVRKIYAENRPRLKGRFVRRSNEMESLQCLWPDDQGLS